MQDVLNSGAEKISVNSPALADPETGLAVQTSALVLRAPAYWPGDVTVSLPDDAISVATPNGRLALKAERAKADLRLHPGAALELDELTLQSGNWSISAPEGPLLSGASMTVAATQSQTPEEYILALLRDVWVLHESLGVHVRLVVER